MAGGGAAANPDGSGRARARRDRRRYRRRRVLSGSVRGGALRGDLPADRGQLRQRRVRLRAGSGCGRPARAAARDAGGTPDTHADEGRDVGRVPAGLPRGHLPGGGRGLDRGRDRAGEHRRRPHLHRGAVAGGVPRPRRRLHVWVLRDGGGGGDVLRAGGGGAGGGLAGGGTRRVHSDGDPRGQQPARPRDRPGRRQDDAGGRAGRARHARLVPAVVGSRLRRCDCPLARDGGRGVGAARAREPALRRSRRCGRSQVGRWGAR